MTVPNIDDESRRFPAKIVVYCIQCDSGGSGGGSGGGDDQMSSEASCYNFD